MEAHMDSKSESKEPAAMEDLHKFVLRCAGYTKAEAMRSDKAEWVAGRVAELAALIAAVREDERARAMEEAARVVDAAVDDVVDDYTRDRLAWAAGDIRKAAKGGAS
jgi:hypothetical protein